jgi:hypothetical protein
MNIIFKKSAQIHKIIFCKAFNSVSKFESLGTTITINLDPEDSGTKFFENIGNNLQHSETSNRNVVFNEN